MDRSQIALRVDDELSETVFVESLGSRLLRLEDTPILANYEEDPMWAGDVVETKLLPDGTHLVVRIVERSPMRHLSLAVPAFFVESAEYARFGAAVVAAGGWWQSAWGGLLWVHLPPTSAFDAEAELSRRIAAARSQMPEA